MRAETRVDVPSSAAARGPNVITGPSSVFHECIDPDRYELDPSTSRFGTWSVTSSPANIATIVASGVYSGTTNRWVDLTFSSPGTSAGTATLTWTSGSLTYSKNITVTIGSCGTDG